MDQPAGQAKPQGAEPQKEANMSIEQFIDNEVKSNDVVLFMKGTPQFPQCGFSGQVVQILDHVGVGYKGLNVLESAECRKLGGCETGDAKITKGYLLPARHVIHAVGPIWYGGNRGEEEQLASCYRRAIELCRDNNLESVAFPAISTGAFRFPAERAAKIAVTTTVKALPSAPSLTRVIFCCF